MYYVNKDYGQVNDNLSYEEYLDFTYKWLEKCLYWTKPDGRLCMNIPGRYWERYVKKSWSRHY
ncbi:DNA methyltransferase [uncultured Fenollaria sp.]|uniref:DNA methyltransferase n=1 Tax=uncultured Fenollaria sp. TaxID=1686315 RepID=UPI00342D8957